MNVIQHPQYALRQVIERHREIGCIWVAIAIQGVIFLGIYRLLSLVKLGGDVDIVFFSEALLVLIAAPYLSARRLARQFGAISSDELLLLSPIRSQYLVGRGIVISQIPTICFTVLSPVLFAIYVPSIREMPLVKILLLHTVLGVFIFSSAAVGALGWRIFGTELYAAEFAYCIWLILIGGVLLLTPLERYVDNLKPFIPPFLHVNPLLAVQDLLGIDIFRVRRLYHLTVIPSYDVIYPSWYTVCAWQGLIGICCFGLASSRRFKTKR
jgi:hypothetical protein